MKKHVLLCALGALALALAADTAGARDAYRGGTPVTMNQLRRSHAVPPLGRKQGWLAISNYDWQDYSLDISKDNMYIREGAYGGIRIPAGATITIALEKDSYDLRGSTSDKLKVRVREGRTTTLSLEPFGYVGATGLNGIANDGDRVRQETLIDSYASTVIVAPPVHRPPPAVIVERPAPPPPPPVIINRPPVIHPPAHRPPPHRPGPGYGPGPGRPGPGHGPDRPGPGPGHRPPPPKKDGLSILLNFGR